jgi:predicted metal-dependent peptidase
MKSIKQSKKPRKKPSTRKDRPEDYSAEEYQALLSKAEELLNSSRTYLLSPGQRPYLASAVFAMRWIPRLGLGTFAVDSSWRMYYDPEAVVVWNDVVGIAAVIEHEVWHLLRNHSERAKNVGIKGFAHSVEDLVDARLWNFAADAEIHSDEELIEQMKGTLIDIKTGEKCYPITPQMLGSEPGHIAEYYYDIIRSKMDPKYVVLKSGPKGKEEGRGGRGRGRGKARDDYEGYGGDEIIVVITNPETGDKYEIKVPTDPGSASNKPSPGEGNDGSGATGQKSSWEDEEDGGPGRIGKEVIRNKVARKIIEHSQTRGSGAGNYIREWADEYISGPKISWQEELKVLINNAVAWVSGSYEYTRSRFSRRQQPGMPLMPGLMQPIPEIAIVIDTSGSMNEEMLATALSEAAAILENFGRHMGIQVYSVDDAVGWVGRVFDVRSIKLIGAGGTDMGKGIRAALIHEPRPNIIIVLTDGQTPWPDSSPEDVQMVIAIVGDKGKVQDELPTWASKIIWID